MNLKSTLQGFGLGAESLDEFVTNSALTMAQNANNDGLKSQIDFLYQAGQNDNQILSKLLFSILEPGMSVVVTPPKHDDSPHQCSFTGVVSDVHDNFLIIIDMDKNDWHIMYDEIAYYY